MKNILNEYIDSDFTGRLLYTVKYIKDSDVRDKKVLDVGCGFGWVINNVLERGAKQAVGLEVSALDLKTARGNIKDKKALFKVGSAIKIPFQDGSFNTVVSFEVLEHVPKNGEGQVFAEVSRVLKKDGIFYLSTPYSSLASKALDPAWWLIGHRHYCADQLRKWSQGHSFKVIDIQVRGRYWNLINALNMYFSKWVLRRKPLFADFFNQKENLEFQDKDGLATIFLKAKKI